MRGGEFTIDKKAFLYVLFFMVGFMIAIVIVETFKISMNYAWIPFLCLTVMTTITIIYTVEDVRLHEVVLAAVSSVILSFMIGTFGAISGALLLFQGVSVGLGFAAASVSGMAASLAAVVAAIIPTVVVGAAVGDPQAAARAALIPLPPSPPGSPPRSRANTEDDDWLVGGRHRRGGLRWRW